MKKTFLFIFLIFISTCALANESAKFLCDFRAFADADGLRSFSRPFKFNIIWDTEQNIASYVKEKQSRKLKINDSIDMVSFVDMSEPGRVTTTSIAKSNGKAVYSVNRLGLSHQAYGSCNFASK